MLIFKVEIKIHLLETQEIYKYNDYTIHSYNNITLVLDLKLLFFTSNRYFQTTFDLNRKNNRLYCFK